MCVADHSWTLNSSCLKWMDLLSTRWIKNRSTIDSFGNHAKLVILFFSSWKWLFSRCMMKQTESLAWHGQGAEIEAQGNGGLDCGYGLGLWICFIILVSQNFNVLISKLEIIMSYYSWPAYLPKWINKKWISKWERILKSWKECSIMLWWVIFNKYLRNEV